MMQQASGRYQGIRALRLGLVSVLVILLNSAELT